MTLPVCFLSKVQIQIPAPFRVTSLVVISLKWKDHIMSDKRNSVLSSLGVEAREIFELSRLLESERKSDNRIGVSFNSLTSTNGSHFGT